MKIAIIPARGGSKRIPKKNIKQFCGKPMIAWSIEAAKESGLFDYIIVSTDNDEIRSIAKRYGAEVPFVRPAHLSGDIVGTTEVMKHAVEWFVLHKQKPDYICELYPTAPFLRAGDIAKSLQLMQKQNAEMIFSVTRYEFPIQRAIRKNANGRVEMLQPEYGSARSQDLEEVYHDAGQFYWFTYKAIINKLPVFSKYSIPYTLPTYRVQDIDVLDDWRRAELMFSYLTN